MKTSRIFGAVVAVLLSLSIASAAHAVRLGPIEAHPYLGVSATYDDNIYVQKQGEVDDWYFTTSPGLLLRLPIRKSIVELDYKADIYRYADTGANNDVEDHNVRGLVAVNLPAHLSLRLEDIYTRGHEARGDSNLAVAGVAPINKYKKNDFKAELGYDFTERFKVTAAYINFMVAYDLAANNFRNRMDNGADVTLYYKFMPKTSALLEGTIIDSEYTDETKTAMNPARLNETEYSTNVGLTWDVTAKSKGTVKVGYEWVIFDEEGRKNFTNPVFAVSVEHHFTPKTSLFLTGSRRAKETDDPVVEYITSTTGQVKLRFNPVTKIFVSPYASITNDVHSSSTVVQGDNGRREDDIYKSGIDAAYNLNKWLAFNLGYKYTHRVSSFTFFDYVDNSVTFGVKGTL